MGVESGSSLGTFRACPKKYEFMYREMLEPQGYSKSMGYGSFIHLYRAIFHAKRSKQQGLIQEAHLDLDRYRESVLSKANGKEEDVLQIERDEKLAQRVIGVYESYWGTSVSPLSENDLMWLEIEKEWKFNIGDDTHRGKRDGLVKSLNYDKTFLYELKTATDRDRDEYLAALQQDYQINSNLLALQNEGVKASGVLYDIIWKPGLRLKKDETLEQMNDRILECYITDPAKYFQRLLIARTESRLAEYKSELSAQFHAIDSTGLFYRNPSNCRTYGSLCPFFGLCMDGQEEQRANFKKRDTKFPELKG